MPPPLPMPPPPPMPPHQRLVKPSATRFCLDASKMQWRNKSGGVGAEPPDCGHMQVWEGRCSRRFCRGRCRRPIRRRGWRSHGHPCRRQPYQSCLGRSQFWLVTVTCLQEFGQGTLVMPTAAYVDGFVSERARVRIGKNGMRFTSRFVSVLFPKKIQDIPCNRTEDPTATRHLTPQPSCSWFRWYT
jgi:hypothetical protein